MNRGTLIAIGGFVLLGIGIAGGASLAAAALPRPEPLPTTTPIVPSDAGSTPGGSVPESQMPTFEIPGQRWGDLLRPDDILVTPEQLAEYARANEWRIGPDYEEWVGVNSLVIQCMADAGFWFDPRVFRLANGDPPPDGFGVAMDGDTGAGDAYRWQDAGCWGAATHELGTTS